MTEPPLDVLTRAWRAADLPASLTEAGRAALDPGVRGDAPAWHAALAALPALRPSFVSFGDTVTVGRAEDAPPDARARLSAALRALHPWRKGPFSLFGVDIDSEWRSDWKWRRVAPHVTLLNARVLDVGCGNGYYGWRMLDAGARSVLGVDPGLGHVLQHAAVAGYLGTRPHAVLPLRLEDLPPLPPFDVVFSMGVVYHRRDPLAHLRTLRALTAGHVVVESLVVDDAFGPEFEPADRYARMRNVWTIPTCRTLCRWLEAAGFRGPQTVDVSVTTVAEQRSTEWMRFESLSEALDPDDPRLTVEGYPAPKRAVIIASA